MDITDLFDFRLTPIDGGWDVEMTVKSDLSVVVCDSRRDSVSMMLRDAIIPRIGSRYTVGGKLVKVTDIEIDAAGHIFVISDTGEKFPWA